MKKKLIIMAMFILLMLAAVSSAMAACSNHREVKVSSKAATCTTAGKIEYRCYNCGKGHTETIPKTGHGWGVWYDTVTATCQRKGTQAHNCRNCGTTATRTVDYNRSNHQDWGKWETKRAACHPSGGYEERKCKCGQTERNYFAKKEHDWNHARLIEKKDATYLDAGYTKYQCPDCPSTKQITIEKLKYGNVENDLYNSIREDWELDQYSAEKYTGVIASWNLIIASDTISGYDDIKAQGDLYKYAATYKPNNISNAEYNDMIEMFQYCYINALFGESRIDGDSSQTIKPQ